MIRELSSCAEGVGRWPGGPEGPQPRSGEDDAPAIDTAPDLPYPRAPMPAAALSQPAPVRLRTERPEDAPQVEAVVARAFGPGRFAKVSYRVRDLSRFRPDLSFVAEDGGRVVGTVRLWDVGVGGERVLFLGPIAVEQSQRGSGLGGALVQAVVAAAEAAGERAVLLVGDRPFFAPFGFERARAVTLPGPVDPARVLVRTFGVGDQPAGAVSAPPATTPAA